MLTLSRLSSVVSQAFVLFVYLFIITGIFLSFLPSSAWTGGKGKLKLIGTPNIAPPTGPILPLPALFKADTSRRTVPGSAICMEGSSSVPGMVHCKPEKDKRIRSSKHRRGGGGLVEPHQAEYGSRVICYFSPLWS